MDDRFEELRTFVAIVENGGVNAAAAAMGIARSAPSRRLAELEQRLGVTLIERGRRGFEVTAVGRDYLRRTRAVLAALADLDHPHGTDDGEKRLVVAAEPWLSRLLAPALAAFRAGDPAVVIDLVVAAAAETADVAVLTGGRTIGRSADRRAGEVRLVVCGAPAYLAGRAAPSTAAELAEHEGIAVDQPELAWTAVARDGTGPRVVMTMPDVPAGLAAATVGAGLALLPDFAVRDAIAAGTLVPVPDTLASPAVAVSVSLGRDAPSAASALADHLADFLTGRRQSAS